ncbi:DUF2061 domain-containing protein [Flavicella marina]|uniref:DUF2061 domain-containing protein n=1 Tax=Flavicella marina TaxID=1475951 RepID=UPI0012643960|nr:DUF2061 domain-containing protein [Flavicella marina]
MILDRLQNDKENQSYQQAVVSDKPIRSLLKAISWRVVGTVDTLIVSLFITGEVGTASAIAGVDFVTKMILYFFHERVWNTIKWGR